ncbi:cobalamin-binding protein [Massilia antarctica]|uniref:cobalamin-binding protein n=1 Tax=Massilia antarctica TaxID=2765360 RepID=UPI0006BB6DFE|nr:cobalamin-binding protein [Massilia sp. H27-R4]MCY0914796.1 cobalamin-binding protein [Massilia sp. H27-R4]CUI08166.1 Vitamin B12 ABC transporter, B12-binding component BtuF [Janthinobacterium sp. CG23_2]CUU31952.1 Vitamin B12 ABC transporter, B12-binding component BtuF [Janthinobacterium sp. CG23_2]
MRKRFLFAALAVLAATAGRAGAAITVVDDTGRRVVLAAPAQRIVSMAPHVTELLFAAGGGARVVGAMSYSDYPPAARTIPLVGDNSQIDIERVLALKPDLLVVWQSGNTARQLEQLRQLGIPMFYSEPARMDQVAASMLRFGQLLGTEPVAQAAAASFRARIAALAARYSKRAPVKVFYQVWEKPLYTLNGQQIASDAIRLCGGENIFAALAVKAPAVGIEAVLQADPEAIVGSEPHDASERGLAMWAPYKTLLAVRQGNLFTLDGELLTRAGPRLPDGAAILCEKLDLARQRRK